MPTRIHSRHSVAAGITYSLDGMDSGNTLSRPLIQKFGKLILKFPILQQLSIWGQYFQYSRDLEHLWIDYVTELATEAALHPDRDATVVADWHSSFLWLELPDNAGAFSAGSSKN